MTKRPSISLTLSGVGRLFGADPGALVEVAVAADEAGIHQVVLPDHVLMGTRYDRYPYGDFPYPPDEPWLEPLTLLAAVASRTSRIRLGTGVLIAPLRPAPLLAKTAATLDVLSGGRLDLGVGFGWQEEEFAASGLGYVDRGARTYDILRACIALWSSAPASFTSESVSFEDVWCLPSPRQREVPSPIPLSLGVAASPRNASWMAEIAAGWLPLARCGSDEFAEGLDRVHSSLESAGRDPERFAVRAGLPLVRDGAGRVDLERSLDGLDALGQAGATTASVALGTIVSDPTQISEVIALLGTAGA